MEKKKTNYIKLFKLLFTKPKSFFDELNRHINILVPMLIIVLIMGAMAYLTIDKQTFIAEKQAFYEDINREAPPLEQLNSAYISQIAAFMVGPLLELLVKAALVAGLATIAGGHGTVKMAYSIALYSYMPVLIGRGIMAIATGSPDATLSMALLMPNSYGSFIYYLVNQLDIFIIMYQILMIIGIREIFDVDFKRAIFVVLCPWVLWITIKAGFQNLNYYYGTDILI